MVYALIPKFFFCVKAGYFILFMMPVTWIITIITLLHVYVKRQTGIRTTWPTFLFTCRLLFIISTPKLVVSRKFLSIRIAFELFLSTLFLFWEIFNSNLTFAVRRFRKA